MTNTVRQYRTAKRHDVRLLQDSSEIAEALDIEIYQVGANPRPRCGKCHAPTEILRGYDGREVGRWCKECGYFWVLIEFEKVVKVREFTPWGRDHDE